MPSKTSLESKTLSLLKECQDGNHIYVGYSGGMDSHVLLNTVALCRENLTKEVIAVHVNHGLNEKACQWAEHCQVTCDALKIKFIQVDLNAVAPKGESQEEWARDLRYHAFMELLGPNDIISTAHHKDDLAETLLLQLLRGAGPAGLSAMPDKIQFGIGWHVRPFLGINRKEIVQYARELGLDWITDDSNDDERFDRNYLRHNIIPALKHRWPGMLKTFSRVARIQSGVNELIEDLAAQDLSSCLYIENNTLSAQSLGELTNTRAINVIRFWLKTRQHRSPGAKILEQILTDVVNSEPDASPCISWAGIQIRRYRDMIFLTHDLPATKQHHKKINWDTCDECLLDFGILRAGLNTGKGLSHKKIKGKDVNVRFRDGNEKIKLGGHHHSLKNVFQENGIPPCFRELIPLIYIDDTLVEIAGLCINNDFIAGPDEKSLLISWDRANEVYAMRDQSDRGTGF